MAGVYQTVFGNPEDMVEVQQAKPGFGEGSFVVVEVRGSREAPNLREAR